VDLKECSNQKSKINFMLLMIGFIIGCLVGGLVDLSIAYQDCENTCNEWIMERCEGISQINYTYEGLEEWENTNDIYTNGY
jgi:hypothetical protein